MKIKRWVEVQKGHWMTDTHWEKYLAVKEIPEIEGEDAWDKPDKWPCGLYGPIIPNPHEYYEKRGWKLYEI